MASIDPTQLSNWFQAYSDRLALYARQWLDAALADDVVQDVFLRMVSLRTQPSNIPAWLFRSVRNASLTQIRSRKRRRLHEEQRTTQQPAWFEPQPDEPISSGNVQSALELLPHEQREIVILKIWGNMTLQEVADIVEQPISTVFSRYRSALAALRRIMEKSNAK
ncbi:MAG: RNA polymerase sigma factor [Phycisphaerae bacterium]